MLSAVVPEVADGLVDLRAVARNPGIHTKIAVESLDPDVDAIASCTGPGHSRMRNLSTRLGGDRIDVITWSDIPERLVKSALAPARVRRVELDLGHFRATAFVRSEDVDFARGRDNENQKLASDLTGWTITIIDANAG